MCETAIFRFVLLFSCKYISKFLRGRRIIDLCRKTVFVNGSVLFETAHFLFPKSQLIFRFRIKYSFQRICLNCLLCIGFYFSFIFELHLYSKNKYTEKPQKNKYSFEVYYTIQFYKY